MGEHESALGRSFVYEALHDQGERAPVRLRERWARLQLAPDGRPRPDAPFGRGPLAARVLARVIDGAVWAGCRVPTGVANALAVIGGHLEWALRPAKRARLAENLAHAINRPPTSRAVRRLVRREIVNEAHRSADLLWALGRPEELLATVELDGVEHAKAAAAAGRGVLLTGVHLGGWELATAVPKAVLPVPTTALVADDWLAWAIEGMRARSGLRVVYRTEPAIELGRRLRAGEAVVLLGDDGSGPAPRRLAVRFLDAVAELPAGLATLARLYQCQVVVFAVIRLGPRRWRIVVDPPHRPPPRRSGRDGDLALLQELADRWSELIRAHPDQWAAVFPIPWHEVDQRSGASASSSIS